MQILKNTDLSTFNTLQLRSEAEFFFNLSLQSQLKSLLADHQFKNLSWRILGGGSNLVLPTHIAGLVLKIANTGKELVREDNDYWYVKACAGESWHEFVLWTLQKGYAGLENLSLIPGTVGAAPIQNIGAYGVEVKDTICEVSAIDLKTGAEKKFTNSECAFSYRDSYFKNEGLDRFIIWDVTFKLPKKNTLHLDYGDIRKELELMSITAPTAQQISQAVIKIRETKLPNPKIIGNAGSFFKNPIVPAEVRNSLLRKYPTLVSYPYQEDHFKLAAGWLIDQAGWKGKKIGPVGMYEKQALVLVNHGGALAVDVWTLANQVAQDVKNIFGVEIEPEPIRW